MRKTLLLSSLTGLTTALSPLIAGLGSSYASGPGLNHTIGDILQDRLIDAQRTRWDFTNLAEPASWLLDVTKTQSRKLMQRTPALIYIISGGNEMEYVSCLSDPHRDLCYESVAEDMFRVWYETALSAIVDGIKHNTSVPIYVITYPAAIDEDSGCGMVDNLDCLFSPKQMLNLLSKYRKLVDYTINSVYEWKQTGENAQYDVRVIPMHLHSAGHHVMSQDPWINGILPRRAGGVKWQLNDEGANAVAEYIFNDFVGNVTTTEI